ncbi:MAG TPA: universal stress protein [Acidobacteriaceae bacterium]|nr:universal stress protein [Acidobacteriaceae bacterium]
MTTDTVTSVAVRNVAVATDLAPCSERAVQHALAVARHFGAMLHFLHLVRPSEFVYAPEMLPAMDDAAVRDCDGLIRLLKQQHRLDDVDFRCWIKDGEPEEILPGFARDERIDLLLLGTHGRGGLQRLLQGSVAQRIFHVVRCPVAVIGPHSPGAGPHLQLKKVLFSTDLSRESLAALPWLLTIMREWHPELDIVHVCSNPQADHAAQLNHVKSSLESQLSSLPHSPIRSQLLAGRPASAVLSFAEQNRHDLIVLGLKPQRALYAGPIWCHAYEIVRHAPCPVLSIRS